jgi:hypothetical protein
MRVVVAVVVVVGFALGGATGCGDDSLDPVPLEEFSAAAQDAVCAWAVRCAHVPEDASCRRLIDPKDYDVRRSLDAIAAGRLSYDADEAARCLAQTATAVCLATPFADPSCGDMFGGLVGEGGACTSDFECAEFAECEITGCGVQCCLGSCGPPGFDPGDPPPRAAVGEDCESHLDCVDEAYCETDGRCTALPVAEGERCLFGCGRGDLFCDVDTLTCGAYADRGDPCDPAGATAPPCDPTWSYCDGVCTDRPGEGEACDSQAKNCIASTWCDGDPGTCRARGGAGSSCSDSDQCEVVCDGLAAQCVEYELCTIDG